MKQTIWIFLAAILFLDVAEAGDVLFKKSRLLVSEPGNEAQPKEHQASVTFTDSSVVIIGKIKTIVFDRHVTHQDTTVLPYYSISSMTYERSTHSRVAAAILLSPLFLFSKGKHHWFTFEYFAPDSRPNPCSYAWTKRKNGSSGRSPGRRSKNPWKSSSSNAPGPRRPAPPILSPPGQDHARQGQEDLPRGTGRILLMDDEDTIHRTAGRMPEGLGYEVEPAYDGDQALQVYKAALEGRNPHDLVIMDLTIPGGMGGKEAVGKLHEIHPDACVVVSSGYSNDPVMANPEDHGFLGTVKKPIGLDELAETVRAVLAGRDG